MFKICYYLKMLFLPLIMIPVLAQEIQLKGKIRDNNTHRKISGVNVYIGELNIGTVSDASGRFQINVMRPEPDMIVTFQHVSYDTLELMFEQVLSLKHIDLQERVIPVPVVEIESLANQLEIANDLPQTVSVLNARIFDLRGFIDAGDLLRTDHSIQIDEELNGKKSVSMRGGSPDEVIVMYNGIKLNSTLDNIFDISLIDLTDIERLEIIKGSNTTLYGSQGFSGVINVVPRAHQDYKIRFQKQIGSYGSGNWGLHLYRDIGKLNAGYSFKKGNIKQRYTDKVSGRQLLENSSEHQTASLAYNFSETITGAPKSTLGVMYIRSDLDYKNERDSETLSNFNQMVTTRFKGDFGNLKNLTLSGAYQWLDETQFLKFFDLPSDSGLLERGFKNRTWHFNADKKIDYQLFELLLGYQYKKSNLDFMDDRIPFNQNPLSSESFSFNRRNHGFISIAKFHGPHPSKLLQNLDFALSVRYDVVNDKQLDKDTSQKRAKGNKTEIIVLENSWEKGLVKFSTHLSANNGIFSFNTFINIGTNVKFPTLLQQISTPKMLSTNAVTQKLQPEKVRSLEVGMDFSKKTQFSNFYGWKISGNFFQNSYKNKFRTFYLPGTPIAIYDNVDDAKLIGFETKQSLFLFRKKMTLEFGASRYLFSDNESFPFKHDRKVTFDFMVDHAGYSLQLHGFKEGKQIAQIRNVNGGFSSQQIPSFANLDIHFNKTFELSRTKLILNASLRNIFNDQFDLEGLALRERRYYFTMGVQY